MREEREEHAMPVALLSRMPPHAARHPVIRPQKHRMLAWHSMTACEHGTTGAGAPQHAMPIQHAMPHPSSPSPHALPSFPSAAGRMACRQLGACRGNDAADDGKLDDAADDGRGNDGT
jgi:hypothetical protein